MSPSVLNTMFTIQLALIYYTRFRKKEKLSLTYHTHTSILTSRVLLITCSKIEYADEIDKCDEVIRVERYTAVYSNTRHHVSDLLGSVSTRY